VVSTYSSTRPDGTRPGQNPIHLVVRPFVGFRRCLHAEEKFQSDSERKLTVILDRDAERWFRSAKGQFQIVYKSGADLLEYQPDFVAETADAFYMLEAKARNEMETSEVLAKREAALLWCKRTSDYGTTYDGGKPWKYALIPHDEIAENMSLAALIASFELMYRG
jgi:type III restriction enzyme